MRETILSMISDAAEVPQYITARVSILLTHVKVCLEKVEFQIHVMNLCDYVQVKPAND